MLSGRNRAWAGSFAVIAMLATFGAGWHGAAFVTRHVEAGPTSSVDPGPVDGNLHDTRTRVVVTVDTDEEQAAADAFALHPAVSSAVPVGDRLVAVELDGPDGIAAELPGVVAVEEDVLGMPFNDTHFPIQYALENTGQSVNGVAGTPGADIRWRDAHARSSGRGTVVAVIDSGVDLNHPDLAGRGWRNAAESCGTGRDDDGNGYVDDCYGWDFVNDDPQQYDTHTSTGVAVDNSHGTHVSGTIAAKAGNGYGVAGVAPDARIMPLKVMENGSFPMSRAALAVRYAVDNGADVINASWGTQPGSPPGTAIIQAVQYAEAHGVLIVAAAGNSSTDIDALPVYPAALPNANVVSVGASDNRDLRAGFSNYGRTNVDLFAPGWMILSTVPNSGFAYFSGTSMAAPHVAGAAALLLAAGAQPDHLRDTLMATAEPVNALAGLAVTSARLDGAAALGDSRAPEVVQEDGAWFTGLTGLVADRPVESGVTVRASGLSTSAHVDVTLAYLHAGAAHAVLGHPVTVNGTWTATDGEGVVRLASSASPQALAGGVSANLSTGLPAGDYALLVELDDGSSRSAPAVVLFRVAAVPVPGDPPPDVETPPSPAPAPDPSQPAPPPSEPPPGSSEPAPPPGGYTPPSDGSPPPPSSTSPAPPSPGESPPDGTEPPGGSPVPPDGSSPPPGDTSPPPGPGPGPEPAPGTSPPPAAPAPSPAPDSAGRVFPSSGPATGGTSVAVSGSFPGGVHVRFGGLNAAVTSISGSAVHVMSPAHVAGTVDVTVLKDGQVLASYPQSFTYLAADGTAPPPSSGPVPSQPPPSETAPPVSSEPSDPPWRVVGEPFEANGLLIVALGPSHPLAGLSTASWAARCAGDPCAGLAL